MILTDKCKASFETWAKITYPKDVVCVAVGYENGSKDILEVIESFDPFYRDAEVLPISMLYAIIVEFFDEQGMYAEATFQRINSDTFTSWFDDEIFSVGHKTRTEALKAAITKANEVFNNK